MSGPTVVEGQYFEDFERGQIFDREPALTITDGHAALYQAIVGDRLRLTLDGPLNRAVTGSARNLAHPVLVAAISIGQTTVTTQLVRANLFYRGLLHRKQVFVGDTLQTTAEVVRLRQNRGRDGREPTGLVVLRVQTLNQDNDVVLSYWRCPMIPMRNAALESGHRDAVDDLPAALEPGQVADSIPPGWRLDLFRQAGNAAGPFFAELSENQEFSVSAGEVVTSAPELARMTLNMARVHYEAGESPYETRLVYGAHVIAVAFAQTLRALPALITILGWQHCDHLAPVFEGDVLRTRVEVVRKTLTPAGGMLELRAVVTATSVSPARQEDVLDWGFLALSA